MTYTSTLLVTPLHIILVCLDLPVVCSLSVHYDQILCVDLLFLVCSSVHAESH